MDFAHYYRTEEKVGTGDFVFRRYSSKPLEDNSRFIKYVEGTLEELTPEDFGNITSIPSYTASYNIVSVSYDPVDKLTRIELPDIVTSIGESCFNYANLTEIIFSASISSIAKNVCNSIDANCVLDFSKAKKVPTVSLADDGDIDCLGSDGIVTIKVPSSLASAWKSASGWSSLASKIVSV